MPNKLARHLLATGHKVFFFGEKEIYYELIKRKRVAFETSKAKASSTCARALEKARKSEDWTQPVFASRSAQPFATGHKVGIYVLLPQLLTLSVY
jgi:hypothetical protein